MHSANLLLWAIRYLDWEAHYLKFNLFFSKTCMYQRKDLKDDFDCTVSPCSPWQPWSNLSSLLAQTAFWESLLASLPTFPRIPFSTASIGSRFGNLRPLLLQLCATSQGWPVLLQILPKPHCITGTNLMSVIFLTLPNPSPALSPRRQVHRPPPHPQFLSQAFLHL